MPYIRIRFGKEAGREFPGRLPKDALHSFPCDSAPGVCNWQPHMDMYETAGEIVLLVEVAGVRREDLHLEVSADHVTVSGGDPLRPLRAPPVPAGPRGRRARPCHLRQRPPGHPDVQETPRPGPPRSHPEQRLTIRPLISGH